MTYRLLHLEYLPRLKLRLAHQVVMYALRNAVEDNSTRRVLELMLTPAGDEVMGRLFPEDIALLLNDARL